MYMHKKSHRCCWYQYIHQPRYFALLALTFRATFFLRSNWLKFYCSHRRWEKQFGPREADTIDRRQTFCVGHAAREPVCEQGIVRTTCDTQGNHFSVGWECGLLEGEGGERERGREGRQVCAEVSQVAGLHQLVADRVFIKSLFRFTAFQSTKLT